MSEQQKTIQKYVSDMLSLTHHIHEAVERQLKDERVQKDADAFPLINRLDGILEGHINSLETHLKTVGGDAPSPVKEAVSAVAGIFAGLYDKVRTDTVSKMLRDDYTALSLASIAHTMLHTTGLALQSQSTADIALSQLNDLTPVVVDLSEVIPLVVTRELIDDGEHVDLSVGPQAVKNTQKAWSREQTQ